MKTSTTSAKNRLPKGYRIVRAHGAFRVVVPAGWMLNAECRTWSSAARWACKMERRLHAAS